MKIIDLLNKIANGEEVPMLIKWNDDEWYYMNNISKNYSNDKEDLFSIIDGTNLNDEVEILEEEKKEIKPLTKKDVEALGYACGEIQKCFKNGWNKSLENKPLEEEKKIPEKLEYYDDSIAWVIDNVGQLSDVDKVIIDKLNEVLDYLKSKGE